MRQSFFTLLSGLLLLTFWPSGTPVALQRDSLPIVKAVLFWSNGCPHCQTVLQEALPPLQKEYGPQLHILLVELITLEDIDRFYQVGASLGLEKEQVQVPLLLIGEHALLGAPQILAELPDLIERYMASGGVDYPALPALAELLSKGIVFDESDLSQFVSTAETNVKPASNGFALAWIVMAFMILGLAAVVILVIRAYMDKPLPSFPGWLSLSIPVLCAIGLGVALYLTYVETTSAQAICGPVGDCNAVQSSPYAMLFGFLPVGLLGAGGYVAILATWLWQRFGKGRLASLAAPAISGMALFGTLFSIYLTYLELFVIKAVCLWCLSSAVIITLILVASTGPLLPWITLEAEGE